MRFCIVGTGRCGTTLLWRMLNSHPDIFIFRETHWLPKMYEFFGMTSCNTSDLINIFLRTTHITGDLVVPLDRRQLMEIFRGKIKTHVAEFYNKIGSYFATRDNKKYWADKTPDYGYFMQLIQTLWPECKFIHIVRNGLAVAQSMSTHDGYRWLVTAEEATWCSASYNEYYSAFKAQDHPLSKYISRWHRSIVRIRDESSRIKNGTYMEIFYEDLLRYPDLVLKKIASFVDIQYHKNWSADASEVVNADKLIFHHSMDMYKEFDAEAITLLKELNYL